MSAGITPALALQQLAFARTYTHTLLADVPEDEWFRQPQEGTTHVAWQVGHLAMAEYMLTLFRLRGKTADDETLIPKAFLRRFLKQTTPNPDPSQYPPTAEIRTVFDAVHAQVLAEVPQFSEEDFSQSVVEPYAVYPNRLGSLMFASYHEMLHAGQIGLLRRLLGKSPVR